MAKMERSYELIMSIGDVSPAQVCQAFFVFGSVTIMTIQALPTAYRQALMDYGARLNSVSRQSFLARVLDCLQVPHSWFLHFYILSASLSVFWGWQYVVRGSVLREIALAQVANGKTPSMDISQVYVAWALMALQGIKRLYESFFVTKSGKSPMSSIHWLLGLFYYSFMSVSVWVEGSGAIINSWEAGPVILHPPKRLALGAALFTAGWMKQHQCHKYLASLKKYTLPEQDWFKYIVCAHYTSECLLYLGICVLATPSGQLVNNTVLLGLLFVAVNLGATAKGTKEWYAQKFGAEKVAPKWRMIPFVW